MGHELKLCAVDEKCQFIAEAHRNHFDHGMLQLLSYSYFPKDISTERDPERKLVYTFLHEMFQNNLGIEKRNCDLDRRYDWLLWTLKQYEFSILPGKTAGYLKKFATNQEVKIKVAENESIAKWCILGQLPFSLTASSTQGYPIGWNSSETTQLISDWLGEISLGEIELFCNPEKIVADGCYKADQAHRSGENINQAVVKDFQTVRDFYKSVSLFHEAVLCFRD
jgi:hypothetical protein